MLAKQSFRKFALSLCLALVACVQPQVAPYEAALTKEGKLYLYLQPIPQGAYQLSYRITGISAIRDDGGEIQLEQALTEVKGKELISVQKRLAAARLPTGSYKGLSIQIGTASMVGEEGLADLLVQKEPFFIEEAFTVLRGKASTLQLSMDPESWLRAGFQFEPNFILAKPEWQLPSLLGYATNSETNNLTIFNKMTKQVVNNIATQSAPKDVVLDQDRDRIYVALAGDDAVEVIEASTGNTTDRLVLNFHDEPSEIALVGDGEMLVSANSGTNTVSIIDTNSMRELGRVRLQSDSTSVVVSPSVSASLAQVYVLQAFSNSISVIDLSRRELTRTQTIGEAPIRGDFSGDGNHLYVITRDSPDLLVIDPATLIVSYRIYVGIGAISIKVDTRSGLVYVGKRNGEIAVIDPASSMFIDTFRVSGKPRFMAIDGDENTLFAVLPDLQQIQKLDLVSKRTSGFIEVEQGAYAVVVMGER